MSPTTKSDREVEARFLRFVRIDTQSDHTSTASPSTEQQLGLFRLLADELRSFGARDVRLEHRGVTGPRRCGASTPHGRSGTPGGPDRLKLPEHLVQP